MLCVDSAAKSGPFRGSLGIVYSLCTRQSMCLAAKHARLLEPSLCGTVDRPLRLRRPDLLILISDAPRVFFVVAGSERIGPNTGQHTPDAHGGPLQPSHSELARQVRVFSDQPPSEYGARRAAYDLKKLRAKKIVQRIGQTRRYQSTSSGLKAIVALVVLRNKAIKPLLAAAQGLRASRGAQNPTSLDRHYETIRTSMQAVFQQLGMAA